MRQKDLVFAFFDDWCCCCWKLTFRTTVVTLFSLHPISLRWVLLMNGHDKFCPLWEELSPYVPQVQKSQGWRGAWQAEPWRFFLVIVIVNTITRARATRGLFFFYPALFAYRMDTCSSVHMSPSASWHRKGKTPGTGDSHFSCWGKAGTDSSNPTHSFLFVFFGWIFLFFLLLSTAFCDCCQLRK